MSGRNNRIVRNRERSSKGIDWKANYTKIAIVGSLLFLVLLLFIVIFVRKNQNTEKKVCYAYGDTEYEYFLLYANEKVGVIDKNGNKIIDAKYSEIYIPNPAKDVFICCLEGKKEILNKEEKPLFADFEQVQEIPYTSQTGLGEVEKYVLMYQQNNLYGVIDLDGNRVTEPIYDEISSIMDKPGSLLVKQNDKFGVLDSAGNTVIDVAYDEIVADGFCSQKDLYEKTGYIVSQKSENSVNFGYIDAEGNKILDTKYESLERALEYDNNNVYLIAMQKGKKGVFKNKKKIIDLNFQEITYSDLSNVFVINKNGKYGFYQLDGKVILKPEYTNYSMAGNYISVEKENEKKLFDINGNLVGTNSYTKMIETQNPAYFIAEDEEGFFSIISKDFNIDKKYIQIQYAFDDYFIVTDKNGKAGIINALTGEEEINAQYDFIICEGEVNYLQAIDGMNNLVEIYSKDLEKTVTMKDGIVNNLENGYAIIYSETDMKYINQEGKLVENTEVYPDKKFYAISQNNKWGFANATGEIVVECQYDIVTEFNEYGFAGIRKDGKWGVVDENGEIIVEPSYELDTYYFPQFIGKYLLIQSEIVYCEEV